MTTHNDDIRALFEGSDAPAPRAELSTRILAEARSAATPPAPAPANDNARRWPAFGAIAAMLVAAVFAMTTLMGGTVDESENWASYADASGFAELYAWVEGE